MIKIVDSTNKFELQAEEFENRAKVAVRSKNYEEAILLYEDAMDIYITLKWNGKIKMIEKIIERLYNVIKFENSNQSETNFFDIKQKIEPQLDKSNIKQEFTIEVKNKLAKIEMLEKKANFDELHGNLKRSVGRYQLILELISELDSVNQLDFNKKVEKIKEKINQMTNQLKSNS